MNVRFGTYLFQKRTACEIKKPFNILQTSVYQYIVLIGTGVDI
jgi:hypothetical protein